MKWKESGKEVEALKKREKIMTVYIECDDKKRK